MDSDMTPGNGATADPYESITDWPNPPWYSEMTPGPLDVAEHWALCHHKASALKYIARAGRKPGPGNTEANDLRKAITYLSRRIAMIEATP